MIQLSQGRSATRWYSGNPRLSLFAGFAWDAFHARKCHRRSCQSTKKCAVTEVENIMLLRRSRGCSLIPPVSVVLVHVCKLRTMYMYSSALPTSRRETV